MTAQAAALWILLVAAVLLGIAAWLRYRIAIAHGTEEPELSAAEAAQTDQAKLVKLARRIGKKL